MQPHPADISIKSTHREGGQHVEGQQIAPVRAGAGGRGAAWVDQVGAGGQTRLALEGPAEGVKLFATNSYGTPPHRPPPTSPPPRQVHHHQHFHSIPLLDFSKHRDRREHTTTDTSILAGVGVGGGGVGGGETTFNHAGRIGEGPDEEDELMRAVDTQEEEEEEQWGEDDMTLVFQGFGLTEGGEETFVDREQDRDERFLASCEKAFTAKFGSLPSATLSEMVHPLFDAARDAHSRAEEGEVELLTGQKSLVTLTEKLRAFLAQEGDSMLKTYDEFAMRKAALLDRLMALDGQRLRKQDDFREKLEEMAAERRANKDRDVEELEQLADEYRKKAASIVSEKETSKEVNKMLKTILGK